MRLTRIYIDAPLAVDKQVVLPEQAATHLTRVLRLRAGAALTLFNGQGGEYVAELLAIERGAARAAVLQQLPIERESPLRLTLLQGISRGERMDLIVQKATELGIERLVPIAAEHGVVKLDPIQGIRRVEHWQAIAISACEQCGRNRVPSIGAVQSLARASRRCHRRRTAAARSGGHDDTGQRAGRRRGLGADRSGGRLERERAIFSSYRSMDLTWT